MAEMGNIVGDYKTLELRVHRGGSRNITGSKM